MEFNDFFKDPETGEYVNPFKTSRRDEVRKWLDENTFKGKGKVYGPGELIKEIKERHAKLEQEKKERGENASKSEAA